jgi:hypothetical protein
MRILALVKPPKRAEDTWLGEASARHQLGIGSEVSTHGKKKPARGL